jgi:hypothetical protein
MRLKVGFIIAVTILISPGCSRSNNTSHSDTETTYAAECTEPSNPWSGDGGGHEAGFNWAQENGEDCPMDYARAINYSVFDVGG